MGLFGLQVNQSPGTGAAQAFDQMVRGDRLVGLWLVRASLVPCGHRARGRKQGGEQSGGRRPWAWMVEVVAVLVHVVTADASLAVSELSVET